MATQYEPIVKDSTLNTTEQTPRNLADVLASGLANIANNVKPDGSDISIDVPGMSANNVDDGFSELKQSLDDKVKYLEISVATTTNNNVSPYGAFGEYTFSSVEKANGTAVSAAPKGITSTNPSICTIRGNNGGIYVFSKTAATITVIVTFVN